MTRTTTLAAVCLLAIGVAGPATPASAAEVCGLNRNGDNFLSLRNGPGSRYEEMTRLSAGTYVDIIGSDKSGSWLQVVVEGEPTGWVSARYICQ